MQIERGIGRPSKTCASEDLGRCRQIRAQTAASHHTMPTGASQPAPDVRPGALGGRRAGFDVPTALFCCRTGHFECCKLSEPKLHGRRSSRVLMFGVLEHPVFPRSFRVLAYRSLVLLRVPQHEAQMSAVHRGDGGTP